MRLPLGPWVLCKARHARPAKLSTIVFNTNSKQRGACINELMLGRAWGPYVLHASAASTT